MDLGVSLTVETVHVLNNYLDEDKSERMGSCAIYTTDDANHDNMSTSQFTKCSNDFLDGGFKKLSDCKGRYLMLIRTGEGMFNNIFSINEIRAFSVPNLINGAAVIEAPDSKDPS